MKINSLIFTVFSLFFAYYFLLISPTQASQYGEVEIHKSLSLDKKVLHPNTKEWKDNLFIADYKFSPGEEVSFKLTLTNTGNTDLTNLTVKDILPKYLALESGALGWTINRLPVGQTYTFDTIKARVLSYDQLPQGIFGVTNISEASGDNMFDRDNSQIYIEKKYLGFTSLPEAGPGENLILLLGSLGLGLTGFYFLRKQNSLR